MRQVVTFCEIYGIHVAFCYRLIIPTGMEYLKFKHVWRVKYYFIIGDDVQVSVSLTNLLATTATTVKYNEPQPWDYVLSLNKILKKKDLTETGSFNSSDWIYWIYGGIRQHWESD